MAVGKNRYYRRSRIAEAKFRRLVRAFAMDLTATDAAELTGLSLRSVNDIYLPLRRRIAERCAAQSPFRVLRCPSEVLRLIWGDIDGSHQRFTVHSPKTEHHEGHESRIVPLFPEVAEALERLRSGQPEEAYVITRYRLNNLNLRTQLNRILRKAGVQPWPKLFQNLRSSRETELAEHFPLRVVTAWLGNSVSVAQKHHLQVTEAHMAETAKPQRRASPACLPARKSDANATHRLTQIPTLHLTALSCMDK